MKIIYVTGQFPNESETFVVRQILGLLRAGQDIGIISMGGRAQSLAVDMDFADELSGRIYYAVAAPTSSWKRAFWALGLMVKYPSHLIKWIRLSIVAFADTSARYHTYFAAADALLRVGPCDLVNVQFGHMGKIFANLKKCGFYQTPLAVVFHGGDSTLVLKKYPGFYRKVYAHMDKLLPVSQALADIHLREGCPSDKIEVFWLGIDLDEWPFRPASLDKGLNILGIGRLVEKKGFGHVIKALAILSKLGVRYCFHIAGDGPLRVELEALALAEGVRDQVIFNGWIQPRDLPGYFDKCAILVVPSVRSKEGDEEGLPTVIKEAMASGVLVVGSRHSGIPEIVRHGETGYLFEEGNVEELARRLFEISRSKIDSDILKNARQLVERECSLGQTTEKLIGIYQKMVGFSRT